MKVSDLIAQLKEFPQDAEVVQAKDGEGNSFSPLADVSLGRYEAETTWGGQWGLLELTDELKKQGYGEEDVPNGPPTICLWPTN